MEDLSDLNWSVNASNGVRDSPPVAPGHLFINTTARTSHNMSREFASTSSSPAPPTSRPRSTNPPGDSFANLVSFNSTNPDKNLSLIDRQKKLQEEKDRKAAENRIRYEAQYGALNSQLWDRLEQGGRSPAVMDSAQQAVELPDEDDLLSAFDASAPVDASTHFPVPSLSPIPPSSIEKSKSNSTDSIWQGNGTELVDDDDPFDLGKLKQTPSPAIRALQNSSSRYDDDDFLGLLGKPVSEFPRQELQPAPATPQRLQDSIPISESLSPADQAVAELVDMGFPADKASQALSTTESGTDIQAAVSWLLNQAHSESRRKVKSDVSDDALPRDMDRSRERGERRGRGIPAWMDNDGLPTRRSRSDNRSPGAAGKDATQLAADFGSNLLKTANSLWKTGSRKVQQVVNDLNTEQDPNAPRWMRTASAHEEPWQQEGQKADHSTLEQRPDKPNGLTDEALLLDGPPPPHRSTRSLNRQQASADSDSMRPPRWHTGGQAVHTPAPMPMQQHARRGREPKSNLSRKMVEEESARAYVSQARRKRPVPQPPTPEKMTDLFESTTTAETKAMVSPQTRKPSPPATIPTRPKAPLREIPVVSQSVLICTHGHRERGIEAYKRGDYVVAHEAFSTALTMLPDKHPVNIILHGNHAMTALKIGEPKAAIIDADAMLSIIGPSRGETESIEPGNGEPSKPMRELFGKALMRKAEALEQLERWSDAAAAWKLAVEMGHGGSTSIQGRNRCEKAAGISKPIPKPLSKPRLKPTIPKAPSAFGSVVGASPTSSEAVGRLRAANQEAERVDRERFALSESIDARISGWKNGKQDNLRALLGSLDTVLWPEAGWKKVNMSELILPNKVKVHYMKGISKVHPDKLPTDATTEQRMIAGAVFGILNEAWDKFRKENNL